MPETPNNRTILCLDEQTWRKVITDWASRLRDDEFDPWMDEKETMRILRISSKTTFQKYRDSGKIDYRRISKKHILYRRKSVLQFIEDSPKEHE